MSRSCEYCPVERGIQPGNDATDFCSDPSAECNAAINRVQKALEIREQAGLMLEVAKTGVVPFEAFEEGDDVTLIARVPQNSNSTGLKLTGINFKVSEVDTESLTGYPKYQNTQSEGSISQSGEITIYGAVDEDTGTRFPGELHRSRLASVHLDGIEDGEFWLTQPLHEVRLKRGSAAFYLFTSRFDRTYPPPDIPDQGKSIK